MERESAGGAAVLEKVVLIGGIGRSGTTLARRIVGSHSRIAMAPAELKFASKRGEGRPVREILSNEKLGQWEIELSDLYDRDPGEAFVTALRRYRDKLGKDICGEKSTYYEFYYPELERWLKGFDFRFIHLLRNPIDVVASFKYFLGEPRPVDVATIARNWYRSAALGLARSLYTPDRYRVVRYEDLVLEPVSSVESVCRFLGVAFEEERMLHAVEFGKQSPNTSFPAGEMDRRADYDLIRRMPSRKEYLTSGELAELNEGCGELALACGYDDEVFTGRPLSRSEGSGGLFGRIARAGRHLQALTRRAS